MPNTVPCQVQIPDHQLLRPIGKGSYGLVWLARSAMGTFRAVKIVFRDRFQDERPFNRELSGIKRFEPISRSHEGFVDILQVGFDEAQGCFYYVMEIGDDAVTGQSIDPETYCPNTLLGEIARRGRLTLQESLRLAIQLTDALNELHRHGLIHRDIKPSNIIFVNGTPKLADIGLVAEMDATRSFVGTEGFIPPEGPGTPQSDVYSLGKVLYEAVTGKDRLDFPELPPEWSRSADYAGLLELNEVILQACQQNPANRYASAWDMHAELLVVLNGKSVSRLRKLEQRWKAVRRAGSIAAIAGLVVCGLGYHFYREWSIRAREHDRALRDNISYGSRTLDSGDALGALPFFAEALRLEQGDRDGEEQQRLRFGSALAQCPKPVRVWQAGGWVNNGQFSPDGERVLLTGYFGKAEIRSLKTGQALGSPFGPGAGLANAAFSPDGRFVVTASEDNTATIWDAESSAPVRELPHNDRVFSARFSPNGTQVVTACLDGWAYVWSAATGQKLFSLGPCPRGASFAGYSRDGTLIAVTSYGGRTGVWRSADGQALPLGFTNSTWAIYAAFSPDNQRLAVASTDHNAKVWDLGTGHRVFPALKHDDLVRSVEFSPDGRLILTAGFDGTARLWRAQDLQPVASNPILRHGERVTYAGFNPDGRLILTTCTDGSVRVWDQAGSILPPPAGRALISRDGSRLLELTNGHARVRETVSRREISPTIELGGAVELAELNADGTAVLSVCQVQSESGGTNRLLRVWDGRTGQQLGPALWITNSLAGAVLSPDGKRMATWAGNTVRIREVNSGEVLAVSLDHPSAVDAALFSPSGDRLATVSDTQVFLWGAVNGRQIATPLSHPVGVKHVEFSRDGRLLATCCADKGLTKCAAQVWDAATGQPAGPPLAHADGVLFVSFSPDNRHVVTASEDFTTRVWETITGKPVGLPLKLGDQVTAARFSPDGKWMVTACKDGTAQVWDPENNLPLTPPLRHLDALADVKFLPDSRHLAVTDEHGRLFVWELAMATGSATELSRLAAFLSGAQAVSAGVGGAEPASLVDTWQHLLAEFPRTLALSEDTTVRWHQFAAEESEAEGDWLGARFHLRRVLKLRPADETVQSDLERVEKNLGTGAGGSR